MRLKGRQLHFCTIIYSDDRRYPWAKLYWKGGWNRMDGIYKIAGVCCEQNGLKEKRKCVCFQLLKSCPAQPIRSHFFEGGRDRSWTFIWSWDGDRSSWLSNFGKSLFRVSSGKRLDRCGKIKLLKQAAKRHLRQLELNFSFLSYGMLVGIGWDGFSSSLLPQL
ncbi:hypothetical protein CDAR_182851 [Caerostris darwini]|uniref:Uncharacterized protein n=1 Tax=Caerostris darwini TaxID=1538125 RepID=A0AAV4SMF4_9ARAC|nr:hypothetical protein CDAR_182851 [Caerostris darwini]